MFEGLLRNGWWYTSSSNTSNSINSYLLWNIFFKNSVNVIFTMCANKFLHLNIFSFFFPQIFLASQLNSFPLEALNFLIPFPWEPWIFCHLPPCFRVSITAESCHFYWCCECRLLCIRLSYLYKNNYGKNRPCLMLATMYKVTFTPWNC